MTTTTNSKFYWLGFEDGFAGGVCNDECGLSRQEGFAYRQGFRAGIKAAEEAARR